MKIINNTGNTIYVDDIDKHFPYVNGQIEEVDPDTLKKSRCLRSFIVNGVFDVESYNADERIESSIIYLRGTKQKPAETPKVDETDDAPISPSLDVCENQIEVKIHGIFYDAGGYAKVNRNLAIKLHEAGLKVKIDPKKSHNQLNESELSNITPLQHTKISKNHILIDSVIPSFSEMSSGKYKILYTTIESYSIPKQFQERCQLYDEIWLTSEWSANILRQSVNKPIYSVVTGADQNLYSETGPKFNLKPNVRDFVFVSVFGWNYRKGYDVLLKAYLDEFSAKDNVTLLIVSRYQSGHSKFHQNKIRDDIDEIMKKFPNKDLPHISRYSKVIQEEDMPKLYRGCNCFVLPSRGEGGNLTAPEASLCGLPVIMTNCSGQQGYLRPDNAYLLEIDRLETVAPGLFKIHYWDGQIFPSLTSSKVHHDLRQLMRSVYTNYEEAKNRNKRLQKMVLENFTWTSMANQAIARLKAINETLGK